MKLILFTYLVILLCFNTQSQVDHRIANEFFKKGNYLYAIDEFHKLLKLDRENAEYNYKLGVCYLKTNIDKTKAAKYLSRSYKKKKHPKETTYYLGIAYAINYEFDKAIEVLTKYIENQGNFVKEAQKRKSDCVHAKTLMQSPIEISFTNLGSNINSDAADYYPFISGDEHTLSYTSRRKLKGKIEYDGYYPSDVYICNYDGSVFSPGRPLKLNSPYNDQSTGMSLDGTEMFYYSDRVVSGELFIVKKEGDTFKSKSKVPKIDLDPFLESAVCVSPDGNTIIFSSNTNKAYEASNSNSKTQTSMGQLDLWMLRKLNFGDHLWAVPQNLGSVINTSGNEDFPSFSPDGNTIYFSSDGRKGMGGYDLYSTKWNPENNTFETPVNLGYPLNTPDDERSISFANDYKHAYISACRSEGLGDLDIYRVTFELTEVKPALFNLKLTNGINSSSYIEAEFLSILDKNDQLIGEYLPNPNTHVYTIILPPGEYKIEVEAENNGYQNYSGTFKVHEFMNQMGIIEKIIELQKK